MGWTGFGRRVVWVPLLLVGAPSCADFEPAEAEATIDDGPPKAAHVFASRAISDSGEHQLTFTAPAAPVDENKLIVTVTLEARFASVGRHRIATRERWEPTPEAAVPLSESTALEGHTAWIGHLAITFVCRRCSECECGDVAATEAEVTGALTLQVLDEDAVSGALDLTVHGWFPRRARDAEQSRIHIEFDTPLRVPTA